jgi:hypothetical protein
VTGRVRSCKELTILWPDARSRLISDDRTRQVSKVPYWNVTGRVRSFSSRVWIVLLPSETRVNTINASGPRKDRVWSTKLKRSDCQHWPDASGWDRDRVRSRVNGSNDFETWRNLNRVAPTELWTLHELPSAKFDKCAPHLNKRFT